MSILEKMVLAVEKVRQRLLRASSALSGARIDYAVIGGNAVAAWVARVDEAAVRNTQDVDLLLERCQLEKAIQAMHSAGFVFRHVAGVDLFLDGPNAKAREAVHIVFAGEKVRPDYPETAPSLKEVEEMDGLTVLSLSALVAMKLTSYRDKDRTHIRDLIEVGLVDKTWLDRVPVGLVQRLQAILDNPEG
jgi:hypothetical protein